MLQVSFKVLQRKQIGWALNRMSKPIAPPQPQYCRGL